MSPTGRTANFVYSLSIFLTYFLQIIWAKGECNYYVSFQIQWSKNLTTFFSVIAKINLYLSRPKLNFGGYHAYHKLWQMNYSVLWDFFVCLWFALILHVAVLGHCISNYLHSSLMNIIFAMQLNLDEIHTWLSVHAVYRNAFTSVSSCSPSRSAILTGQARRNMWEHWGSITNYFRQKQLKH